MSTRFVTNSLKAAIGVAALFAGTAAISSAYAGPGNADWHFHHHFYRGTPNPHARPNNVVGTRVNGPVPYDQFIDEFTPRQKRR